MPAESSLISVTAKIAAYYRQFSSIPFAQEVAKRIGAEAAFDQILSEHGLERDKLDLYAAMFEARYKSITQLIDASAFEDGRELADFLDRMGFHVQVRSQADETPSFSSIQALGLSPASIERLRGVSRVWVMTTARPLDAHAT
jgi:hypothetical protein